MRKKFQVHTSGNTARRARVQQLILHNAHVAAGPNRRFAIFSSASTLEWCQFLQTTRPSCVEDFPFLKTTMEIYFTREYDYTRVGNLINVYDIHPHTPKYLHTFSICEESKTCTKAFYYTNRSNSKTIRNENVRFSGKNIYKEN